jgi:hypothetical protein
VKCAVSGTLKNNSFVDLLLAASETDETFCEEDVVHELNTFMLAVRTVALVLA